MINKIIEFKNTILISILFVFICIGNYYINKNKIDNLNNKISSSLEENRICKENISKLQSHQKVVNNSVDKIVGKVEYVNSFKKFDSLDKYIDFTYKLQ